MTKPIRGRERRMKRPFAAFALAVLALTALAGGASATHTEGGAPNYDYAVGSAKYTERETQDWDGDGKVDYDYQALLQVNAKGDPTEANPVRARGTWSYISKFQSQNARGEITCLRITGPNSALVGGRFTSGGPEDGGSLGHDGEGQMWEIIDNGPGTDDDVKGWGAFVKEANLQSCEPPWPREDNPAFTFQQGNFTVHDATP